MSQTEWDREAWIKAYCEKSPDAREVEFPTPEKEEAIAAEAKKVIAEGAKYADAPSLGYRAYDATEKRSGWYAHAFWVSEFLSARGLAHAPYRRPGEKITLSSFVALDTDYENGPGRAE